MKHASLLAAFALLSLFANPAAGTAAITLKASASGTTITASVSGAPGLYTDDVIAVHSNATNSRVAWCYLSGTESLPSKPLTSATCTFKNVPAGEAVVYYDEYAPGSGGTTLASVNVSSGAASPPVTPPPVTTAASDSYVITPNPAAAGKPVTVQASINPGVTTSGSSLVLWFYSNAGSLIGSATAPNQSFTSGQITTVTETFTLPAGLAAGTYYFNSSLYKGAYGTASLWGHSHAATFNVGTATTPVVPPPASCAFAGTTLTSGTSVTAYLASSVPSPQTCQSEKRVCSNGTLSGTYAYANCVAQIQPTGGKIKWNPGHYMMAAGPGASQWNIDTLAKYDHSAIKGFAGLYVWNQFESNTAGEYDFSAIVSDFNYLQSKIPGAHFAIGIAAYQNFIQPVADISTLRVSGATPAYILNDAGTYGKGPPGASQGGYGLGFYQASNKGIYGMMNSALWNENVMTRYMALFDALAKTALPLNGVQYTVDTNPLVEFVFDWGPSDLDMGHGNPLVPSDFSNDAWDQQWLRRLPAMSAAFPHTNVGLMPGYGASGVPVDQLTLVDAMKNNRIAISSTDVAARCGLIEYHCTWAQNYFMGNTYDTSGKWVQSGGTDLRGSMASMPTVQPEDYVYPGMTAGMSPVNTPAIVQTIFAVSTQKLHASHIFWASASETTFNPTKDWPGFILPGIQASGPIPAADQAYPSSYPQ